MGPCGMGAQWAVGSGGHVCGRIWGSMRAGAAGAQEKGEWEDGSTGGCGLWGAGRCKPGAGRAAPPPAASGRAPQGARVFRVNA
jgi:hypothetical protein